MGKSRRKSRKYKGGNLTSVDCAKNLHNYVLLKQNMEGL